MTIVSEQAARQIEKQIVEEQQVKLEAGDAKNVANDVSTVRHDVLTKVDDHVKELQGDFMTMQSALESIDYFTQQGNEPGIDTKRRYAGMRNMLKRMDKHVVEIGKLVKATRDTIKAARPILTQHFK